MLTEDIILPQETSEWVGIPLTSTHTIIFNGCTTDVYMRYGALSTSHGIHLARGQTVVVDETVYLRSIKPYENNMGSLKVTR